MVSRGNFQARLTPFVKPIILAGSVLTLLAVFRLTISYLSMNFIINSYATLFAATSWLFCLGQPIYTSIHTQEHYSIPYGPYGYILVGGFQYVLGPSVFSSKLAPFLATFGSLIFLYLTLRTRVEWLCALALTALASALELLLDPIQFWPRPEPFLLLSVCAGMWAATRRRMWGPIVLGLCIGVAIDLKIYGFAFFFMAIAVAWRNHRSLGLWALAGLAGVVAVLLPFAWPNISIGNYLGTLKMMGAGRRFMEGLALQNFEWCVVLSMIGLAPLFINKRESSETMAVLWKNADLWGALLLSFLVVDHPASAEGSGPHHLLPFIPVAIYIAAHLHAAISSKPFLERTYNWAGLSMALSIVLFVEVYAVYTGAHEPGKLEPRETLAKERIEDIETVYSEKMPCVLLNAAGSMATQEDDFYRAILVFNGMPMGIDPAGTMDYKSLGYNEPDLSDFVAEVNSKYHKPIVWICPRGTVPFSLTSYFGSCDRVFSDHFVNDFHRIFQLSGQSACFDLYEQKSN